MSALCSKETLIDYLMLALLHRDVLLYSRVCQWCHVCGKLIMRDCLLLIVYSCIQLLHAYGYTRSIHTIYFNIIGQNSTSLRIAQLLSGNVKPVMWCCYYFCPHFGKERCCCIFFNANNTQCAHIKLIPVDTRFPRSLTCTVQMKHARTL